MYTPIEVVKNRISRVVRRQLDESNTRMGMYANPGTPGVILHHYMRPDLKQTAYKFLVNRLQTRGMAPHEAKRKASMVVMGQEAHLKERFGL